MQILMFFYFVHFAFCGVLCTSFKLIFFEIFFYYNEIFQKIFLTISKSEILIFLTNHIICKIYLEIS